MKQILVALLIFSTIAGTFKELTIYVSFKVHQEEIAFTVCKSRDTPDNTCQGACYLKKQLNQAHEHEQSPNGEIIRTSKLKHPNLYREIVSGSLRAFTILKSSYYSYASGSTCAGFVPHLLLPPENC